MEKKPLTKTVNGSGLGILGVSQRLSMKESMPLGGSQSLQEGTTATIPTDMPKTLQNAELEALRSKIGLVAGALADFQTAGGLVVVKNVEARLASGRIVQAVKIYLVADGGKITKKQTADGMEFDLVAEEI